MGEEEDKEGMGEEGRTRRGWGMGRTRREGQ